MSNLLSRLREKDKKGLFNSSQTSVCYPTGFLPFDYRNGYKVEIVDTDTDKKLDTYNSIGVVGGTFITIIGKTGVAKTTFATQIAWKIVKDFDENAFVMHFDLEQALTITRIKNITKGHSKDLKNKYILRQEKNFVEDIYDTIIMIANEKESNRKDYMYDTGLKDEYNEPIKAFVPTVILMDSIPTMASKDSPEEMEGQTAAMRLAKFLAQFYKKLMPVIKTYNITVIAINHINTKIDINPFAKTQAQMMYLKQDESVPGGNAPIYYANNLLKFVSSNKHNMEDDGFDGFDVNVWFLKSRTNKGGQFIPLVYDQTSGFDEVLSLYKFAEDNKLVEGRNPYRYFVTNKDAKFDSRKFKKAFKENEDVRRAMLEATKPLLESMLSTNNDDSEDYDKDFLNAMKNIALSQEGE